MSEQVPVYIKEVTLVDFKGFRGEHHFSFINANNDWCQWTVFLGNNNTGKTNLLKAIASLEPQAYSIAGSYTNYPISFTNSEIRNNILSKGIQIGLKTIPKIQDTQRDDKKLEDFNLGVSQGSNTIVISPKGTADSHILELQIYSYGVTRIIEKKSISEDIRSELNCDNLFFNKSLRNFEDWLFQLDYSAKNGQFKASELRDVLKSVLTGDIFPEIKDIRFISDDKLNNYIEFETEDGWHRLSDLGYGYQSTLAWMADFCKKLFNRYPNSPNPLKEPAVLLVDEIDLHLHPQWQRGLIKSLSTIFPKTQFIVTTHSPFIIQSMENVNLYSLHRVEDHTIENRWGVKSYIGWTIEEILSDIMDMDGKMHTDRYNKLMEEFDSALDNDDYSKGKAAYDELIKILHPQSAEHKLLDIQFTQLTPPEK